MCHKLPLLAYNNHRLIEVYVNGCFTSMINHTLLIELVNKFALYFLLNSIFLLLFPRYAQLLIASMLVGYVVYESSMSNRVFAISRLFLKFRVDED